ncbi:MAG: hypothetical protein KGO02_18955 [Alphaproteobacteria bacterium]|nr:hypothetical protein [Alphaproteobacteria bacterium]
MSFAQPISGDFIKIATNVWTEPFWQAAKEETLVAFWYAECRHLRIPPAMDGSCRFPAQHLSIRATGPGYGRTRCKHL